MIGCTATRRHVSYLVSYKRTGVRTSGAAKRSHVDSTVSTPAILTSAILTSAILTSAVLTSAVLTSAILVSTILTWTILTSMPSHRRCVRPRLLPDSG
ncbi:pentapeptide repeat-containing protein [Rhodoplanes serenus]|uniref:pentapeptide repeat-containing protein n=1 Tax=Rhodoplanes serenus TaxID=200615 RepID=UPI000DAD71CC